MMRIAIIVYAIVNLFLLAPLSSAGESATKHKSRAASYHDIQTFASALETLQAVSEDDKDPKRFVYAALQSMTEALDRYSYFVPPDLMGLFHEVHKDKYVGTGLQLARSSDGANIEIVSVENGSPAQRARLEPGDLITAIDGKPAIEMRLVDAVKIMRSPGLSEGSKVTLSIQKIGLKNPADITLTRAFIKPAIVSCNIPDKEYGYIRVAAFNQSTVPDFKKAIGEMEAQGGKLKGVIIDLRSNPGGEIAASVDLARIFIDKGVIASLRNKWDDVNTVYRANSTRLYDWPIAVIVDKGTASAAELFAGAL